MPFATRTLVVLCALAACGEDATLTHNHHVVRALPLHVDLVTLIFHSRSSLAFRGLPQLGGTLHMHAGNGGASPVLTGSTGELAGI